VVEPKSRRSFLFGREATADDDWSKFVIGLKRVCRGTVSLVTNDQARLNPAALDDVIQARKLCHAHSVVLALEGLKLPASDQSRRVLWVQAGSTWGSLLPLGETGLWRVDAGCPMVALQAAGLLGEGWPKRVTNLAQWFATAYQYQALADTGLSEALVSVDWLLPDGTIEVFGAFGQRDSQPLGSLAAQRLVPKLFELATRAAAEFRSNQTTWPLQFHLDALVDAQHINLAQVFLGHAGALGWLVAATFKHCPTPLMTGAALMSDQAVAARGDHQALDQQTKEAFDADRVFLSLH